MKKILVSIVSIVSSLYLCNSAQAIPAGATNLLLNDSFESVSGSGTDFVGWAEGGEWYKDGRAHTGLVSARLGVQTGNLYQNFAITSGDILYFGAYFNILTQNPGQENWDQTQINMQIAGLNDTTIGGSVSSFQGINWQLMAGAGNTYTSGWFLVSGSVDISGITLPANSAINISLQNFDTDVSRLLVDDAYAGTGAAVPEPATMLLFGTGLIGLAAIGRRKRS